MRGRLSNEAIGRLMLAAALAVAVGCGGSGGEAGSTGGSDAGDGGSGVAADGGTTAGVECAYSYSAYNSSVKLNSSASWSCGASARTLSGNGVPDHATGTFPNSNNPNAISAQTVSASMPLVPTPAASDVTANLHIVGYALNSVKFDPSTAGTCTVSNGSTSCTADCNMNGTCGAANSWNLEALGSTSFNFGADSNNAHVQPNGAYHYHGMPEGLLTRLGKGTALTLVGFAMDGYPIYARYGYSTASDSASAIKVLKSSWQLKATPDSGRPSTSTYEMGTFTQDYTYVAGSGDLDECNGRTGVTPEFPSGIYAYYVTDTWPFVGRCLKGQYTPPAGGP